MPPADRAGKCNSIKEVFEILHILCSTVPVCHNFIQSAAVQLLHKKPGASSLFRGELSPVLAYAL
jgi:hypothetical protein